LYINHINDENCLVRKEISENTESTKIGKIIKNIISVFTQWNMRIQFLIFT